MRNLVETSGLVSCNKPSSAGLPELRHAEEKRFGRSRNLRFFHAQLENSHINGGADNINLLRRVEGPAAPDKRQKQGRVRHICKGRRILLASDCNSSRSTARNISYKLPASPLHCDDKSLICGYFVCGCTGKSIMRS